MPAGSAMSCNIVECNSKMELSAWTRVLFWLCLACLLAGVASQNVTSDPVPKLSSQEMAGLQALWEAWKEHTPDPAINLPNWGTSDPCGHNSTLGWTGGWGGVICSSLNQSTPMQLDPTVTQLTLDSFKIAGVLPPEISFLSNLQGLGLSQNNFIGQIPDISNLTHLLYLDLSQNNFNSQIPDISNLTNISYLDLSQNNFIGQVPDISNLTNLYHLDLSQNNFNSQIPDISNLINLNYLDLSQNNFTGQVSNMSNLANLYYLNLSSNHFTGLAPLISNLINLNKLDISNNGFNGPFPRLPYQGSFDNFFINWNLFEGEIPQNTFQNEINLEALDLSNNKFTGSLPNFTTLQRLTTLNLGSNFFTSSSNNLLAFTITLPKTLSELYLDSNNITGTLNISAFTNIGLSNISKSLRVWSLQDNFITNVVPGKGETEIFLQGNPYCKNNWTSQDEFAWCSIYCGQPCIYLLPKSNNHWKVIVMATSLSFMVLVMMAILGFAFIFHRNQKHIRHLQKEIKKANINVKWFEYNELRIATKNFASEMKLGAGAHGAVYKGILENNVAVAVKQLFLEASKGNDDFLNEILLISNLQHCNLVTFKGYCLHGKQTLLVYEYVDNCDLDKLLFGRHNLSTNSSSNNDEQVFSWQARLKVCQGVAQGLCYLHATSHFKIIHRDIKASNILLDKNLQPKIADFGLARLIDDAQSIILTQNCAGTVGYLAPEYMRHGQLSDKADVFSFGVLLLEIISGKRNKDLTMPEDEVYLPSRAWKLYKENRIMDLKDATLLVCDDEVVEVHRVMKIAILCVQSAPEKRPSMLLVSGMLAGNANIGVSPIDENDSWQESVLFMDDFLHSQ